MLHRLPKVHGMLPSDDVGDPRASEHAEVLQRNSLAEYTDEMIPVDLCTGPPQFAYRIHGNGVGLRSLSDMHGLRSGRCPRSCNKRLRISEVLLHGGTATNPSVALELLPGYFV